MPEPSLPQAPSQESQASVESVDEVVEPIKREPITTLFTWKAPARPFVKRNREFYTTIGAILFLVCIILLFLKEFLFILVLAAFSFLGYMVSTVAPDEVEHEITNYGVKSMGKLYYWDQLGSFWFEEKFRSNVMYIENYVGFPTRLMLLLEKTEKEKVKALMKKYLVEERPEKTSIERAGDWLQEKVTLETSTTPKSR